MMILRGTVGDFLYRRISGSKWNESIVELPLIRKIQMHL